MNNNNLHQYLIYFISLVWLLNGLFCKVLNLVPRHQQIVASILNDEYSRLLTLLIGISEIFMAIWVASKFKPKLNSIVQIIIIAVMNLMEIFLVPDLLLWGSMNIVFASAFIILIYYTEFVLNRNLSMPK